MAQAWIGVDLDGTLAHHESNQCLSSIGKPIPEMLDRVKTWLREGQLVKIFTARVGPQDNVDYSQLGAFIRTQIEMIHAWCDKNGLPRLEVTNKKDLWMIELWDDRCVQVERNTGRPVAVLLAQIIEQHRNGVEWEK